jgi:hypothetical protein
MVSLHPITYFDVVFILVLTPQSSSSLISLLVIWFVAVDDRVNDLVKQPKWFVSVLLDFRSEHDLFLFVGEPIKFTGLLLVNER